MNAELFEALELLEKTKGIPVDYMLEKVESALVSAFKKEYGTSSVRVDINKEKKDVRVYKRRTVVEEVVDPKDEISFEEAQTISRRYEIGTVVEEEIKTKNFQNFLNAVNVSGKALVVTPEPRENVIKSARNIPGIKTTIATILSPYDVLNCSSFVVDKDALKRIEEVYA